MLDPECFHSADPLTEPKSTTTSFFSVNDDTTTQRNVPPTSAVSKSERTTGNHVRSADPLSADPLTEPEVTTSSYHDTTVPPTSRTTLQDTNLEMKFMYVYTNVRLIIHWLMKLWGYIVCPSVCDSSSLFDYCFFSSEPLRPIRTNLDLKLCIYFYY